MLQKFVDPNCLLYRVLIFNTITCLLEKCQKTDIYEMNRYVQNFRYCISENIVHVYFKNQSFSEIVVVRNEKVFQRV